MGIGDSACEESRAERLEWKGTIQGMNDEMKEGRTHGSTTRPDTGQPQLFQTPVQQDSDNCSATPIPQLNYQHQKIILITDWPVLLGFQFWAVTFFITGVALHSVVYQKEALQLELMVAPPIQGATME